LIQINIYDEDCPKPTPEELTESRPVHYAAIIEINGDDIIITMQCSDEEERRIREIYPEAQSPIFLVLEF